MDVMYDALIFDVDGTLWNTTSTCVKARGLS